MKWTVEMLQKEALKYSSRGDFQKHSENAYAACRRWKILDDVCSHMVAKITFWSNEMLFAEAKKYKTRKAFSDKSKSAYVACCSRGILDDVCSHMVAQKTYWTDDMLITEAKKYKTRKELEIACHSAYSRIKKRKLESIAFAHMEFVQTYWTDDMLIAEAKKYKTAADFSFFNEYAHKSCIKRGIDDLAFSHMVGALHTDNDAIYIWKSDMTFNGLPVYKVGYTSYRLGDHRIKDVAKKAGINAEIIQLVKVSVRATVVEKELKKIGTNPKLEKFNGSTEFRAMNDDEFKKAVETILKYAA